MKKYRSIKIDYETYLKLRLLVALLDTTMLVELDHLITRKLERVQQEKQQGERQ